MKKVLILLAITSLLFGCVVRDRGFSEIYSRDHSNVTRLVIHRGAIGGGIQATREITGEEGIRSFFDLLNSTRFVRMKDQSPKVSFLYRVEIYENDENRLQISFTEETARLGSTNYWLDKNVGKDLKLLFGSGVEIKS
jgi:hypothetical protein